ncbi:MAG: RNA polymerase factor sigma-32 [Proteobacteria bacterium]|nr:RNA polymerase factor sigma-32 [Pseudomonadota bacterium]
MAQIDTAETQRANRRLIKELIRAPMLSREREFALARRWRDAKDEAALHELIRSYMRLAISLAAKYRNYGLPMGDLMQEGAIGLMQAASRFDPERGFRFSTYANWWVRSAMQDYVLRNWSIVRTGTTAAQKSLFFNLRRLRAKIESRSDGSIDEDDRASIAGALGVRLRDVEAMEARLRQGDQSLNIVVGENGEDEWQDFIADSRAGPEQIALSLKDAETRSQWLAEALTELSERERMIINERRLREEAVTLEELGKELGISKERVRQIEHKALQKLRVSMSKRVEHPSDVFFDD